MTGTVHGWSHRPGYGACRHPLQQEVSSDSVRQLIGSHDGVLTPSTVDTPTNHCPDLVDLFPTSVFRLEVNLV